jgi:uncharacterized protein YodC (DUF2158 family)
MSSDSKDLWKEFLRGKDFLTVDYLTMEDLLVIKEWRPEGGARSTYVENALAVLAGRYENLLEQLVAEREAERLEMELEHDKMGLKHDIVKAAAYEAEVGKDHLRRELERTLQQLDAATTHDRGFRVGDVVRLNSGSRAMTIEAIDSGDGSACLTWETDFGFKGTTLQMSSLEKVR